VSRKGGWAHPKGVNSMAMSGLDFESDGLSQVIVLSVNRPRIQSSYFVWPPIPALKADFSIKAG